MARGAAFSVLLRPSCDVVLLTVSTCKLLVGSIFTRHCRFQRCIYFRTEMRSLTRQNRLQLGVAKDMVLPPKRQVLRPTWRHIAQSLPH